MFDSLPRIVMLITLIFHFNAIKFIYFLLLDNYIDKSEATYLLKNNFICPNHHMCFPLRLYSPEKFQFIFNSKEVSIIQFQQIYQHLISSLDEFTKKLKNQLKVKVKYIVRVMIVFEDNFILNLLIYLLIRLTLEEIRKINSKWTEMPCFTHKVVIQDDLITKNFE